MSDQLKDYSYEFPEDLIALYPAQKRDESRLMVLNRHDQSWQHRSFKDIEEYFNSGDILVLNNSKVFPCRLLTQRKTGGRQEILLLHEIEPNLWRVLINASQKVRAGDCFGFDGLQIEILDNNGNERRAKLSYDGFLLDHLERLADMPLPPYIQRGNESIDRERYQTVFAKQTGSVAAPTAGLHFTPEILAKLKAKGVIITEVTLHVGLGTFLPVRDSDIKQHKMHAEYFSITAESAAIIQQALLHKNRITAVGTTALRVLETLGQRGMPITGQSGQTNIFIRPPYEFKIANRLLTNFHQPESTLLILVSALAGREFILSAYQEAIAKKYRLFSYGDAMLIE